MNAVEIDEAVTALARAPFDPAEYPFAFLTAFGNKATTVNRLRTRSLNTSDVAGGVLQARNIHLAVCPEGQVRETMAALRASPKTAANKVKFILATDGVTLEAEDLVSDEPPVVCNYPDLPQHFGFFLALAGISTVRAIKNNPIDIKATGRLNKLYVELLKDNPDWATEARRHEMNQFMARLIFCFFAEDTGIFLNHLFTKTIEQMSDSQSGNTHEVLQELFRAMATPADNETRRAAKFRPWAEAFPYVNGGLFPDAGACPRFSRIARSYLLRAAELNWQEINPDIFGSMIQAVADDAERGELGMHYTSVPNILKVLGPLFLDELREQLEAAGDNPRKLRNLRKRLSSIRVFDPACGSGNFLVIAYREMRQIEHEIVKRTKDEPRSVIPLSNFYGIEIKGFAAEIARLALLIAEFQCDVRLISQREARLNVLPLHKTGQIHVGNALRADWLEVCPPLGRSGEAPLGPSAQLGTEGQLYTNTYICGNPQFKGARKQSKSQKEDLSHVFNGHIHHKDCDYVTGWFVKAAEYAENHPIEFAFVSTNSISQGEQVGYLWSRMYSKQLHIRFAHQGFRWKNNASNNAVVQCIIIGISKNKSVQCHLYSDESVRTVPSISPYLVPGPELYVSPRDETMNADMGEMVMGSMARDDGNLILTQEEAAVLTGRYPKIRALLRRLVGSQELIHYRDRNCLWITDDDLALALSIPPVEQRIQKVKRFREDSSANTTRGYATIPHKFAQRAHKDTASIVVAATSSENRPYLPVDILDNNNIITNAAYAIYSPKLWEISLIASKLHIVWVESICGKLETRLRYSSTLGWNTFPVPPLTNSDKAVLSRRAEDILLTREAHFPATIADLYDPENMPDDLRAAHERNDETLERIYIGRRFRNDTERLEKLFDLYTKMTAQKSAVIASAAKQPRRKG